MAEYENLTDKHSGKKPEEKFLYHGTRKTHPEMVYKSEEGFDSKFCSGGMWGIAVYFA